MTARVGKRRPGRWRCKGRHTHPTYDDARQHARLLGHGHHPYHCRSCRRWHISDARED
jgi:hypothetical protein